MSPPAEPIDAKPDDRIVDTIAAQVEAIDAVLALARHSVDVFDIDLQHTGWNAAARAQALGAFLRHGPHAQLRMILHDTAYFERACPRLGNLLRQHASSVEIRRTGPLARGAMDPLVIVDDRHVVHRFHIDHPRASVAVDQPARARPLVDRFQEIWATGEPGVAATLLGL